MNYPNSDYQPYLYAIGDIGVTSDSIVTPNGTGHLRGSAWLVSDQTRVDKKLPSWAIICAIVFGVLLCGLGLLFLAVKETVVSGYVDVNVRSGNLNHTAQVPAFNLNTVQEVRWQVSEIQNLAART